MPVNLASVLAVNVRRARQALVISQDELAERAGLHRTYVGAIERGERNISLASLQKLAFALGTDAASLLSEGGTNGETA